jgi:hypothetical protein
MSTNQPAPPLVPIGGTIELAGHLFEVTAHTTDAKGRATEVPGRCVGRAPKAPKPNTHAGPRAAVGPALPAPHAPTQPSVQPTPAMPTRKARKHRAPRGDYRRFNRKPPPLVIVNEPWRTSQWCALIVVLALIVAGIFFWNQGVEQKKWTKPGTAQRR